MTEAQTRRAEPADPGVLALIQRQPLDAQLEKVDDRWVLTMHRRLAFAPERVWQKLTEPSELVKWSPIVPDRPLTTVGPAVGHEAPSDPAFDAEVLVANAPRVLVHRWGSQLLRWSIEPTADGCLLTLEHTFDETAERTSFAAGWHIVLAVLEADLAGTARERVTGDRATDYGWADLRDRYDAVLGTTSNPT